MRYVLPMLLALSVSMPAYAAFDGPSTPPVKEASAVKNSAKDSPVVLEGILINKAGDELYIFQDASGEVFVEIDDDLMASRSVTPKNKVRLNGHVDSEDGKPTVDVEMLEVLN